MKKNILFFCLALFLLASCGPAPESGTSEAPEVTIDESSQETKEKKDLFIETKTLQDFPQKITLTKTGILEGSSSIQISAQVSGQIGEARVQEGDVVRAGQPLLVLRDTIGSYYLSAQSARNNVSAAQINLEKTKLSLDKSVTDLEIALEKARLDLENTREQVKIQVATSERNAENSRLEDNIEKARLDLENLARTNQETLDGFERTFENERTKLITFLTNTIDTTDKLLGVSITYSWENDLYEDFLGARNRGIKANADASLEQLILEYNTFRSKEITGSLSQRVDTLESMYDLTSTVLNLTEQMLIDTIESTYYTQTQIDASRASIDALQSTLQINQAGLVSFLNSANTFLATYEQDFASKQKAFELQVQSLATGDSNTSDLVEQTKSSVAQQIRAAENLVITTQNNLENARATRDVTIRQLQNQIQAANIWYSQAATQTGKLTIRSPIDGTIGSVLVDVGQEVAPGTPTITINSKSSVFTIYVDGSTLPVLKLGDELPTLYKDTAGKGVITSISTAANAGLQYAVDVKMLSDVDLLGDFAQAQISLTSPNPVLPLEFVSVISQSQGTVWVLEGELPKKKNVVLGNIWWDVVEIIDGLSEEDVLITTNMSNYTADAFEIRLQPTKEDE